MHPSTGFANSKSNPTSSKLRNFSSGSNNELPNRFTATTKLSFPNKPSPMRNGKLNTKMQPDLSAHSKTPTLKKNIQQNIAQSHFNNALQLNPRLFEALASKGYTSRSNGLPKSASRANLSYTNLKNTKLTPKPHDHSSADLDENTHINKIPVSPISTKRAINLQMGSLGELPDSEMWTEGSGLELTGIKGLQSPSFTANHSIKRNSIDTIRQPSNNHYNTLSFQINSPHHDLDILNSFAKTTYPNKFTNTTQSLQGHRICLADGSTNLEKDSGDIVNCISGNPLFSTMPCQSMTTLNQRSTHKIQSNQSMIQSDVKDTIKSPRRTRQDSNDFSLRQRPTNIENMERTSLKSSVTTFQSSPKTRLASGEHTRSSSTFDNVKSYLSKLDIVNSTTIIKQIFQPKKRLRCSCDVGLDEDQTCSRALNWLKKKYNSNEFQYLKSIYQNIVSNSKPDCADQSKQIQKDLYRTYPKIKFFAENSPGIQALQRVLDAFANYDPQIGYVQGMNFIGASLLYHAEEYITFWLLVMLFEKFEMRDIYLPKLPGLSKHCQIIDMLIFNYEYSLYRHLCQHEIRVEIFCTEWILALFASVIPVENMGNFYDILMEEGWPFFYKIILAFLRQFEKQIMEQDELMGILTVLKSQNHMIKNFAKEKDKLNLDWNNLFQKAQKIEIDSHFIYKMHSNFDVDNQWFRTSFLKNS